MNRLRLAVAALALAALAFPASAAAARVAVVAQSDEPLRDAVVRALEKSGGGVRVFTFAPEDLSDPIRRGQLLAHLVANDLIVPVGDAATGLVLKEAEDVPVYFVGAAVVPGRKLSSRSISGLLAYDPALLVSAAAKLWPGRLGLAYTPGYEPVAAQVRAAARARGLELEERKIDKPRAVPGALDALLGSCRSVLLLGDPLLARGAGFEFAAERSLSRRVPLIGVDSWEVERGAFLSTAPDRDALAAAAAAQLSGRSPAQLAGGRVVTALGGRVLVNGPLSRRWGVKIPQEAGWLLTR